jgi:hypothetical protein
VLLVQMFLMQRSHTHDIRRGSLDLSRMRVRCFLATIHTECMIPLVITVIAQAQSAQILVRRFCPNFAL